MATASRTQRRNQERNAGLAGEAPDAEHRVAVFRLPADREALLRELRRELELNPLDSRIQLHHLPGLLPERLSREDAERVAAAIRRVGGDAGAISTDEWPDLGTAPAVHHVRCADCGLEVVSQAGTSSQWIPWAHVLLISVADVPLDDVRHFVAPRTAVIRATPRIKDAQLESRTLRGAELWIVCEQPFRAVRIEHGKMNYEYLGKSLAGSAAANFAQFLKDLVKKAPRARLTPTARAFIEHAAADKCRYASGEQHRKAVELEIVRLRTSTGAASRPFQNSISRAEMTMTTKPTTAASSGLQEAHAALHREIDDMKEWCREADEIGQPRLGQFGLRLKALREHVAEHFAEEERGGYMSPVVEADSRFAVPVEKLLVEHGRILARFDEVAAKLAESPPGSGYTCWSEGQRDVCSVIADLERHEHAENDLWLSAFEEDTGLSD